jgi:hypothetical protein
MFYTIMKYNHDTDAFEQAGGQYDTLEQANDMADLMALVTSDDYRVAKIY